MKPVTAAPRTIPLVDLKAQYQRIRSEVIAALTRVADSQQFVLGEEVAALEAEIAAYCGVKHAVACASGSDALLLALMALEIGPGDRVLTTPYTFFATASAIWRVGARPVFADVDPSTCNLDMDKAAQVLASDSRIRAVIPVHLFGGCADMEALAAIIAGHSVFVIEDAAQAIGAECNKRRAGSMGHIGCFSFFPSKNLGAFGDGGMVTTNDDVLAEKLRILRVHGARTKYFHEYVGINSRMDAIQAAILRVKLQYLDFWTQQRQSNAHLYRQIISELKIPVRTLCEKKFQTRHVYNQFVIFAERRNQLRAYLAEHGIATEIYYPCPLHLQQCFASLGYQAGNFPVSEQLAYESLALPVYPELEPAQIEYICRSMQQFYS
jgi:dTDP-4-amino-4,6-dideoxygalactose transaminase